MVDHNGLLDQLNKLLDCQWEELIFRLGVDEAHLRANVTKSQRNIDLIRLFEQQENGLQILQNALHKVIGTQLTKSYAAFWCTGKGGEKAYPAE